MFGLVVVPDQRLMIIVLLFRLSQKPVSKKKYIYLCLRFCGSDMRPGWRRRFACQQLFVGLSSWELTLLHKQDSHSFPQGGEFLYVRLL